MRTAGSTDKKRRSHFKWSVPRRSPGTRIISRRRKWIARAVAAVLVPLAAFLVLDALFPFDLPGDGKGFAVAVVAADGTPLRSFPDVNGVWRYPVRPRDVSPLYLEALLNYEDRWFYRHPGVNPWAIGRAVWTYVVHRRPITGGSTLTMQTARLFHPHDRDVSGKLYQMFRALQLEYHFDKDEILTLYLNYAPFGGPIEGVEAAAYAYLGKSSRNLSLAEAALLAVLPQSPSRFRPDRHADRAELARNKVLDRLARFQVWDPVMVEEAKVEQVAKRFDPRPLKAPLLALRLKERARPDAPVRTFIDPAMQAAADEIVGNFILSAPPRTSAAALVVDNRTLEVKAYVGSADFLDDSRFGHVDMVRAVRSPGSTLKPFLYGFALEEGLIHSESLLIDAPYSFSGYRPGNFSEGFSGPVAAAEALRRSLNIPAVDLLDRLGPNYFDARLRNGGLRLSYPNGGAPNLAMILGGVGASLENLAFAYTALARDGLAGRPRFTPEEPMAERRMLSPGAAFIVRQILQEHGRPDLPAGRLDLARSRQVAWKTGTSYGYRDAWALGVTDQYTIGVWVGRPDGTPLPGHYGRATAAPLLFSIVDSLPRKYGPTPPAPEDVRKTEICWPLGLPTDGKDDPLCHQRRTAWTLNGVTPPTLPDRADRLWLGNPVTVMVNQDTGLRVDADCPCRNPVATRMAVWPRAAGPWLSPQVRKKSTPPPLDPACDKLVTSVPDNIKIADIQSGATFRPPGAETEPPTVTLIAQGGKGELYWFLDGSLIATAPPGQPRYHKFDLPGRHTLTVMDQAGANDSVEITVLAGNPES